MKVYFLQLLITKFCNQNCDYCDVYYQSKFKNQPEVDIDFLKYVLDSFKYSNMFIEICGGEPGCVINIDDVYKTIKDHKNTKYIQLMSNGLLRKNGVDWINDIFYNEHLIQEINGIDIKKFYNLDFKKVKNRKYVIVTSKNTIKSILDNYNYFLNKNMFDEMFWYKLVIDKSYSIDSFYNDLVIFYKKINQKDLNNNLEMLQYYKDGCEKNIKRKELCAINSPQPGVDLETKELFHCSNFLNKSRRFPFNKENVQKQLDMKLFELEKYCNECYTLDFSIKKINCYLDSLKGVYNNRSYYYSKF